MNVKQIMKLPYILFVIGMLDAPSIDYDSKKKKDDSKNSNKPKTAKDEVNTVLQALG